MILKFLIQYDSPLNNRKKFINFINGLYDTYRKDVIKKQEGPQIPQDQQCMAKKSKDKKFELLTHQNIVRDYLNIEFLLRSSHQDLTGQIVEYYLYNQGYILQFEIDYLLYKVAIHCSTPL